MATRGKPLAFALRQDIRTLLRNMPVKVVARALGVSKNTVKKYR